MGEWFGRFRYVQSVLKQEERSLQMRLTKWLWDNYPEIYKEYRLQRAEEIREKAREYQRNRTAVIKAQNPVVAQEEE